MKRLNIIFLTTIISLFFASEILATHPDYYSLIEKADKCIKKSNFIEAEKYISEAIEIDPANPSNVLLMSNLGMLQFYDGRIDQSLATLDKARAIAPASVTIMLNRAKVLTSIGQPLNALKDYNDAIRRDSTMAEPRFYKSMILLSLNRLPEAKACIDSLQTIAPDHRLTHIAISSMLMSAANYAQAIPHLQAAIKDTPDASYYASLAFCQIMTENLAEASDSIARGLEAEPTNAELYLYRALLNKKRFRPDDARADSEKAILYGADSEKVKELLK